MSKNSDSNTLEAGDNPTAVLRDFSDRLSPIVVKEMRQGLRQASFVILFLALQSILAMAVISSLIAASSGSAGSRISTGIWISVFFFILFAVAAMVIQPLRGLNALASEIKDSTIDLLLLTRLNSWRIVLGKWLSLMTQSGLLLIAIIPYLMMRYFLGGMNLVGELTILLFIFLFGGTVTAAAVGLSAVKSVILRAIFALVGIFLIGSMLLGFVQSAGMMMRGYGSGFFFMGSSSPSEWIPVLIGILLLLFYLTHSFLEFGATRIAPPSENRSSRKRLISLGALFLIPFIMAMTETGQEAMCYISIITIVPIALADALSENPNHLRPMKGRDSWLLRPGWPSGALFSLITVMTSMAWFIALAFINDNNSGYSSGPPQGVIQVFAVIIMIFCQPVLIIALFRPHDNEPANTYITAMLGSIALGVVILAVGAAVDAGEILFSTLFVIFPVLGFGTIDDASVTMTASMFVVSCVYLIIAATLGYRRWGGAAKAPATSSIAP